MSQILHPGPPPLTIDAVDSAIDLIDFMAAVVHGVDLIDVTKKARKAWRAYVTAHYPHLSPMDRQWFANAATHWATVQSAWPNFPPVAQEIVREQWAAGLAAPSHPNRACRSGSYDDLIAGITANQARKEQEAGARSVEEQLQVRTQNNAINAQVLSSISRMSYESSEKIAANIRW